MTRDMNNGAVSAVAAGPRWLRVVVFLLLIPVCAAFSEQESDNEGDVPSGWEDPGRLQEHWTKSMGPEDYLTALKATGMSQAYSSQEALASAWTAVGPVGGFGEELKYNGRVAAVRVRAATSGYYVYAGASGGGLWRMHSDSPGVWTELGANLPNPAVHAFVIDPGNTNHIIVGTGDPKRYKGAGIFTTMDGGGIWTPANIAGNLPEGFYRMEFQLNNPSVIVAASTSGILRSTDSGANWQYEWVGDATDMRLHPTNANTMYAVARGHGFLRSTDSGQTWLTVPFSTGLPAANQWHRASLDICRDVPNILVVMVGDADDNLLGVWRTPDAGVNWVEIGQNLPNLGETQMFHCQAVGIKPDNPLQIFVGAAQLAWTTNGGGGWSTDIGAAGSTKGHADITQLYFGQASGDDTLWITNDGGIYRHRIGTGTVSMNGDPPTGLIISQIDHIEADRDLQVIGLQDNGELSSVDRGLTWDGFHLGDGGQPAITDAEALDFWYWIGGVWALHRRLGNSGRTHMLAPAGTTAALFYDPWGDRIYVPVGQDIYSAASGDPPDSWIHESGIGALHPGVYGIKRIWGSKVDGKTLFVRLRPPLERNLSIAEWTGSGWMVRVSTDLAPAGGGVETVAPSSEWPGECWVGFSGPVGSPKVFHTTDYGVTWEDWTGNLPAIGTVWALAPTPFNPKTVYAATEIGVYRTTNGGLNWSPFQTGMPVVQCKDIRFVVDDTTAGQHQLLVATYGRGLWTRDVPASPIIYVDKVYAGSGEDGSLEHPYKTVAAAVSAAPAGAIIAIRANTYSEPQTIAKDLTLVTYAGPTTIQ